MKNLYSIIALFLATTLLFSCDKKVVLDASPDFMILPIHNGSRLSTSVLEHAQLNYTHLFQERTLKDFKRATGISTQKGVLKSTDIISLSAVENVKLYTLTIPGYEDVNLVVDYELLSEKDAKKEVCHCDKPIRSVTRDGMPLDIEYTTAAGEHIYKVYLSTPQE